MSMCEKELLFEELTTNNYVQKYYFTDGEHDGLTALLGSTSPDLALASDASDSLPLPDHDNGKRGVNSVCH